MDPKVMFVLAFVWLFLMVASVSIVAAGFSHVRIDNKKKMHVIFNNSGEGGASAAPRVLDEQGTINLEII